MKIKGYILNVETMKFNGNDGQQMQMRRYQFQTEDRTYVFDVTDMDMEHKIVAEPNKLAEIDIKIIKARASR